VRRSKRPARNLSPPAKPRAPVFWDATALPFLERRSLVLALCLIAIAVIRIAAAYPEMSITFDEPAHIACGLQYLAQHVYLYEPQHPPLARAMAALGPYLDGARLLDAPNMILEGVAVLYHGGHTGRTLALARLGILPFFILACLVVYFWARRYFGNPVAVIATGLFTLLPSVLAHAGLATTDMALTACLGAAFLALIVWAEKPSFRHSLLFGAATALAVLSKFTALGFLPIAAVFALVVYLVAERPGLKRLAALASERAAPLAAAVLAGALVVWAGYLFSFGAVPGWSVRLPAPELFDGIRRAMRHNAGEGGGYLFGQLSPTGWWYFFPAALAVKTPIAFLLLLGLGAWLCWKKREFAHWLPWAFSLGILAPAMTSPVNYGVRHVLPVYMGFSIVAALAVVRLAQWSQTRRWAGIAAGALVLWMAVSGGIRHPDYLAYFNELAGSEPEEVLVDSDLDWGQDTILLARRLRELGAKQVSYIQMNLDSDHLQAWPGMPPTKPINPLVPAEGWTAVGPTFWKVGQYGLDHRYPNLKPWFEYLKPVERVGSQLLYYVPPRVAISTPVGPASDSRRTSPNPASRSHPVYSSSL
jgi:4-amino-4-deoxy-L-arabinose transferase-like glycosyltransferase